MRGAETCPWRGPRMLSSGRTNAPPCCTPPKTSCYARNPDHKLGALVAEWISAGLTVAPVAYWAILRRKGSTTHETAATSCRRSLRPTPNSSINPVKE